VKLSAATHHSNVDYNLFEGTEVVGGPELVLVRGVVVIEHDELVGRPGHGQFLRRACFRERLEPVRRRERTVAQ
jgi:dihydropyrimidinase